MKEKKDLIILTIDKILSRGLKKYIGDHFDSIFLTDNPWQALKLIGEKEYSHIIMDLRFPTIDGLELIKKIRIGNEQLQIIIINMEEDIQLREKLMAEGVDRIFRGPLNQSQLKNIFQQEE